MGWAFYVLFSMFLCFYVLAGYGSQSGTAVLFNYSNKKKMGTNHAALWSTSYDARDRTTHHKRTKQRGERDSWTWEEILDGKRPWRQAGEYHGPKEELKAAKEEQRRNEEASHRSRHERHPPQKEIGGTRGDWRSQVIDLSQLLVLTARSVVLVRHCVMR